MKQSKRLFALLLTLAMTLGMLTACGGGTSDTSSEGDGGESSGSNELTVYTAFPEAEVPTTSTRLRRPPASRSTLCGSPPVRC